MWNLIKFEACIGVNRVYLLSANKKFIWPSYFYSFTLVVFASGFILFESRLFGITSLIYKDISAVEFLLLSLSSLNQRARLKQLFYNLEEFDSFLGIEERYYTSFTYSYVFLLFCDFVGFVLTFDVMADLYSTISVYFSLLPILVHDTEIIFFTELMVKILRRLEVLKYRIGTLQTDENGRKVTNRKISKNINMNIHFYHKMYDFIHSCSELLSSIFGFPIFVMSLESAVSTIMLFKNTVSYCRENGEGLNTRAMVIFTTARIFKYTVLFTLPCLYSSLTATQAAIIRSKLQEIIRFSDIDKITRRKVKAFYQLARECRFEYSLWGVIPVDMTMPLAHCGLCITYLVIVFQFSKMFE